MMTTSKAQLMNPSPEVIRPLRAIEAAPAAQQTAARDGAALFDLSDREQVELTGRDRAVFLHNFCTQEIKQLSPGRGAEAFIANIKGKLLGHVLVFAGEQAILLDGPPGTAAAIVPHLDRYLITEDVQITDRSREWGELALIGPQAATLVEALLPGSGDFAAFQHGERDGFTVRRFDFTQQPGWLIGAARPRLPELADRLLSAGAMPCGREVFEALRIDAGFPRYGVDLQDEHLAHEAGRTRQAISFTKGCYLGQEPIARLESLGHTNRELRRLRLADAAVPVRGASVTDAATGKELGMVSSAALLPVDNVAVSLAMLRREACIAGTIVQVETPAGRRAATVT